MFVKNALFSVIIVTGFFAGVEFALALAGVRPLVLAEDPLLGFSENVPQFVKAVRKDGVPMYITPYNKLRLFNFQEFPQQKHDDAYRVFCLGGSTTYGRPYQDTLSFCGWLRAYLQAADPSRKWEVINAGGVSYASYRVARMMNELKDYDPDLFIVYTGQNEFLEQRSYGKLQEMPEWMIELDAALSGTRIYSVMQRTMAAVRADSSGETRSRDELGGEVDEILNHTLGPESYHRDDEMKRQIIMHYRLNLRRMAKIADSVDAGIIFIKPAINIRGMSPFKSEHRGDLALDELMRWQALYSDARALQQSGRLDEALAKYREALAIDDRYAELHYRIGQVLFARQHYEESEAAFRRAVEEDVAPLRMLASMQQAVEEVAEAVDAPLVDFPAIMRQAYRDDYGHTVFGDEYFIDHVHANYRGYRKLGMALFDHLDAADIAHPVDSWDAAQIEAVTRDVLANIDRRYEGETMLNLGAVFDWAGKFEEARAALLHALEILGPNEAIYQRLASSSYSLGRLDEAYEYLSKTLELDPTLDGLSTRLALIRLEQGKPEEAARHCKDALATFPDDYVAHMCLGKVLAGLGQPEKAETYLKNAVRLNPESGLAHLAYARFLNGQKRYEEALAEGREALEFDPGSYKAHNAVGTSLLGLGETTQAREHIAEALRLQPEYSAARENLRRLQAGRRFDRRDVSQLQVQ